MRRWRYCIGGAFEARRLVEHVAMHVLARFMGGGLGQLASTDAINAGASIFEVLSHCRPARGK
jgi:hypothetical protein